MELTLNIPENLVGVGQSDLELLAVSFFSKLASEPETTARESECAHILDQLTEKLSDAGVYDLPTETVPNA